MKNAPEPAPAAACPHPRTRLIAKDDDAQFVECLDCGALLESEELPSSAPFGESLADA